MIKLRRAQSLGKPHYIVVARRERWTLAYPRALWESLTEEERAGVVARQEALFDCMRAAHGRGLQGGNESLQDAN